MAEKVNDEKMIPIDEVMEIVEKRTGWRPELRTVRGWEKAGKIIGTKVGGRVFVRPSSVEQMLDGKESA
tara:strand:- start:175 stop:381 length:207 start_codon:yes stop_codon:yes gene_type:complete